MPEGVADERSFNLLERLRGETGTGLPLADFKALVREQFFTLLLDERRAVDAIPAMLDADPDLAVRMASTLRQLIEAVGVESKVGKARIAEMQAAFESRKKAKDAKNGSPKGDRIEAARAARSTAPAKPHRPHSRNLS
jgi:hypothetical protein